MRNVLFLARGGVIDGHQRQVLYLATGLKAAGTSVIIALDEKGPLQEELAAAGLEFGMYCANPRGEGLDTAFIATSMPIGSPDLLLRRAPKSSMRMTCGARNTRALPLNASAFPTSFTSGDR